MKIRDIIRLILFLFIFASFLVVAEFLFKQIFLERLSDYTASALGAFMGAFFAFVLIRFGDFLNRIRERRRKEYNELIFLERYFNICIQILNDNRQLLKQFIETLRKGKAWMTPLPNIPLREEATINLANSVYINKIFSFMIDLRKLNNDISTVNSWNIELRTAWLNKNINPEVYRGNAINVANALEVIAKLIEPLYQKIIDLASENRIWIKNEKTFLNEMIGKFYGTHKEKVSEQEIEEEKKALIREIKEIQEKSKKDNEAALSSG